ncbi:MAG: DUF4430 domain-containing protein [Desulfosporosinus sp.]|nr:DUF4430 domain-containing protein [Desulfosporosinus sp.]
MIFVILNLLLVTGCGADNKSSNLPNSSAMSGEMANGGAAITDSGHSQTNEATAGQVGEHSSQNIPDVAKSTQDKTSDQTGVANSASAPPANSLSPSTTSSANQASALAQPSSTIASSVSQQPVVTQPTAPVKPTVTIAINCQTAVDKGLAQKEKFQGVVPSDGVILPVTRVEISDGETVFSVLQRATREHKIQLVYKGSQSTTYIRGINGLYEFDGGPLSGWMYSVNKVNANYGCNQTKLNNGDAIEWNYTCDMGKDLVQK